MRHNTFKWNPDKLWLLRQAMTDGISQKDIANDLGVHPVVWNRWESGKVVPSTETVLQLSKHFKVDPFWFFTPGS